MQAYETQLEFSGEKGHAVVVEFDKPWRFVFWDKAQYIGCVDLGQGVWFTPEWCETNSPNDLHCYEPIMDKQLRWSHIQILESGPARVRVKWSYAMNDMRYRIFHGDSGADEIYTIYPDGIAVREVVLWPGTASNHGGNANFWQQAEWILVNGAGSSPLDVLRQPTPFTMRNGCGESFDIPWPLPPEWFSPLCRYYPQIADFPMFVGKVNLNGVPNPFFAAFNDQVLYPHMHCANCGGDHPYMTLFPGKDLINVYKHWPVTAMEDFLEWVPAGEDMGKVATHTSFISVNFASRRTPKDYIPTPDPGASWYFLVGATGADTDGSELEELARSFYYPAQIEVKREPGEPQERHRGRVLLEGYDYSLRAQTFRKTGEDRVEFTMDPRSEEMVLGTKTGRGVAEVVPQLNPVFLINGWTAPRARILADGQPLPPERYATQVSGNDLTVWVEGRFERKTEFAIVA